MCSSSGSTRAVSGSCACSRAIWSNPATARWRCSSSCCTTRKPHERFVLRALRHHGRRRARFRRALPQRARADPRALAGHPPHRASYAARLARSVRRQPRHHGVARAARVRVERGDGGRAAVRGPRPGARGFQAVSAVRRKRRPPGDGAGGALPRALGRRQRGGCLMKPKQHLEFVKVDLNSGWERVPGYPPGFYQKILASDIDETAKKGSRTRLLKIEPSAFSTAPFVHDHWEEVYVVQGDLIVGNDAQGRGGEQCFAPTYACRPPGVHHGPFTSKGGCILHEIHYYETSGKEAVHAKDRR